jgi:hypothetical protein
LYATFIMKNPFKNISKPNFLTLKTGTAKGVSFLASDMHFVLKTAADGVAHSEAFIVNKLTKQSKSAIIEDRHNKTAKTQERISGSLSKAHSKVSHLFSTVEETLEDSPLNPGA